MKLFITILSSVLFSTSPVVSQDSSALQNSENFDPILYFMDLNESDTSVITKYDELLISLKKKKSRYSNDARFIRLVYSIVQKKQLINYKKYASLNETLGSTKTYNCLSGTALYALLMHDLGYDYSILEFNHHVLLMVHLEEKDIMIESTDPYNGYILSQIEMDQIIKEQMNKTGSNLYNAQVRSIFAEKVNNSIKLVQLAGLQYYNEAIIHYNKGNYFGALVDIKKAYTLYPSKRIKGVYDIVNSEISVAAK